jgi:hypothetical protein
MRSLQDARRDPGCVERVAIARRIRDSPRKHTEDKKTCHGRDGQTRTEDLWVVGCQLFVTQLRHRRPACGPLGQRHRRDAGETPVPLKHADFSPPNLKNLCAPHIDAIRGQRRIHHADEISSTDQPGDHRDLLLLTHIDKYSAWEAVCSELAHRVEATWVRADVDAADHDLMPMEYGVRPHVRRGKRKKLHYHRRAIPIGEEVYHDDMRRVGL